MQTHAFRDTCAQMSVLVREKGVRASHVASVCVGHCVSTCDVVAYFFMCVIRVPCLILFAFFIFFVCLIFVHILEITAHIDTLHPLMSCLLESALETRIHLEDAKASKV